MEVKPGSEVDFKAGIAFYNDESKLLGVTPISMSLIAKGDQIKSFEIVTDQDVSGYTYASLQDIKPEPIYAFLPPSTLLDDPTGKVTIEDYNAVKDGDFSKMRFMLGILKTGIYRVEGVLTYYGEADKVIGTADIVFKGKGLDEKRNGSRIIYETAGKGDLTKAKRATLTINKFEPINEIEPN